MSATLARGTPWSRAYRGLWRSILAASTSNVASSAATAFAGLVIARSLGPSVRGEYAAIMVWFGVVVVVGGLGQSAATTYFVARDPDGARDYLATARNLLVASAVAIFAVGMFTAPLLGAGSGSATSGYRLMFATCLAALAGLSYTYALQASRFGQWNLARVAQPAGFLIVVTVLYVAGWLSLMAALVAFSAAVLAQAVLAYVLCVRAGLGGGRPRAALVRPLARYGLGQLAAIIPVVVVARLDQLTLSLTADPAVLGNYAVAASLTSLAVPVAAGLGNVAFPRIAAGRDRGPATAQLQRRAVVVSAGIALVLVVPLAALASWLVPAVFGPAFGDAVLLVVLLAPRGIFRACQVVCGDLLRGHGRPLAVARAQAAAAGLMAVLLAGLLPTLGAPGVAIAASVSAGASFLLLLRELNRCLSRQPEELR